MFMASILDKLLFNLPEVSHPTEKKVSFKVKIKWTLITLVLFFILGLVPLYGADSSVMQQFEYLSVLLGAQFGSLISLGIGPIVTASIVLQLLNGAGIVKFDLSSEVGKKRFQGVQKLLAIFFIIFEAYIYVAVGGLKATAGISPLLIMLQLILGGFMIMFMDEVISKWGFGSGISLFIAANVSQSLFTRAFSPFKLEGDVYSVGAIPSLFQALADGNSIYAGLMIAALLATTAIFMLVVYVQSMNVELPLTYGRVRGYGIRWPLKFLYTSNIPVILIAALMANIQLFARLFGHDGNSGFLAWLRAPPLVELIIKGSVTPIHFAQALVYLVILVGGAVMFSMFWVQTSGLDARSQARNIMKSGLQMPGFRRDERVLEKVLDRYIKPLTVMGGIAVGLLAGFADILGALANGTGLLLAVMIIYQLYEQIAQQHMMDMNPMMKKFMGR
jgi:preprotein translocase subunit SecY